MKERSRNVEEVGRNKRSSPQNHRVDVPRRFRRKTSPWGYNRKGQLGRLEEREADLLSL